MSFLASLTSGETSDTFVQASYMLAALLFILGIKRLSRVRTAQSSHSELNLSLDFELRF